MNAKFKEFCSLDNSISTLEQSHAELVDKAKFSEQQNNNILSEIKEKEEKIIYNQELNKQLQQNLLDWFNANEILEKQIIELQNSNNELNKALLQNQPSEIKDASVHLSSANNEPGLDTLTAENSELLQRIENFTAEIQQQRQVIENLTILLKDHSANSENETRLLKEENEALNAKLVDLEINKTDLEESLAHSNNKIENLNAKICNIHKYVDENDSFDNLCSVNEIQNDLFVLNDSLVRIILKTDTSFEHTLSQTTDDNFQSQIISSKSENGNFNKY